jgi:glycosyltransferase involved in cell wall biosynthesis
MQTRLVPIRLVLFFTGGMSLQRWDRLGMLTREEALYRRLQRQGVEVTFITYGDARERQYAERLPGIRICSNRWSLPRQLYDRLIPLLHLGALRRADVFKTNQLPGAPIALRAARLLSKPLIARCGYMWSEFMQRQHGPGAAVTRRSQAIEWQLFSSADAVVVTTEAMRDSVVERQPWLASRTHVVPNYVDTDLFAPGDPRDVVGDRLCYVGRLDEAQKNLPALVAAVRDLDVTLDLIGDGPLRPALEAEATENPRLRVRGPLPHDELPGQLRRAAAFVLPSHYEGHPKTLIEAMACGVPVIATDMPGIRDLVRDGETGALCGTDAHSLRERILAVLSDADLRSRIGRGGRDFVVRNYSLDRVIEQELALYQRLLGRPRCSHG